MLLLIRYPIIRPIKKLPIMLTVNVEYGKDPLGISLLNRNLNTDPNPPPIKTNSNSLII